MSAEAFRSPALAWLRSNGLTDGKPEGERHALASSLARLLLQTSEGRTQASPVLALDPVDEDPEPVTLRLPPVTHP